MALLEIKKIIIPRTVEDELNAVEWISFIVKNRIKGNETSLKKLIIDFSETKYIYTIQLVSLACLIEEYYQKDVVIEFVECSDDNVSLYLSDIKFFKYWENDFDRSGYTDVQNLNCLCLWQVNQSMIDSYIMHAQNFAENHWIEGKDFSPLHISLSEIFNNINDHSESKISGYIITQYHPKHQKLRISVCDFGIGIGRSVHRFMKNEKGTNIDYFEAVQKAFELRFTVGSQTYNKGMGLDNLREHVCLNGDLDIYTNNIHVNVEFSKLNAYLLPQSLKGTIIDITISTDNLSNIEVNEVDFKLF